MFLPGFNNLQHGVSKSMCHQSFNCDQARDVKWLMKFKAYNGAVNLNNDTGVHVFDMLLTGSAEDWFMALPADSRKTIQDVYAAFDKLMHPVTQ